VRQWKGMEIIKIVLPREEFTAPVEPATSIRSESFLLGCRRSLEDFPYWEEQCAMLTRSVDF
jgi:hypothetical protein